MYSHSMKNAVSSAQSCVDMCCSADNVAVISAQYISALAEYLDVLDPSGIDFLKNGFFTNIKIKNYWKLFSEHYPKVTAIMQKLKQNRIIAENTLMTLKSEQKNYQAELEKFLSEEPENADSEYMNQKTVSLNLQRILENTVTEYSVLSEKIKDITGTASDVFTNAVLIAKVNYQINIVNEQTSGLVGTGDISSFKRDFEKLSRLCR